MARAGLTAKQTRFVQEFMLDGNATQAAIRAGYAAGQSAEVQGHRLLRNAKIAAAIADLEAERAEKHEVTVESIARQLDEDRELAKECKQAGAAVSASMSKAKLYGLVIEKRETINDLEALDDAQLAERVRQLEAALADDPGPADSPARAGRAANGTEAPTRH